MRITFEDRILASDIIFCKTWAKLALPDLYLPVDNLLQSEGDKGDWKVKMYFSINYWRFLSHSKHQCLPIYKVVNFLIKKFYIFN